jgi:hypothetical protein
MLHAAVPASFPSKVPQRCKAFDPDRRPGTAAPREPYTGARLQRGIRDSRTLARAARRAGSVGQEARAHYCLGVLHDERGRGAEAIEAYKVFMALARRRQDAQCEALGANAISATLYRMARASSPPPPAELRARLAEESVQFAAHL